MIGFLIKTLLGDKSKRELKKLNPIVDSINGYYAEMESLSDEELAAKTVEFRRRLSEGETMEDLLPEAYAAVKQACKRKCGQEWMVAGNLIPWDMVPYDVQLIGAIILHRGKIAEMATGEGKTLVAIFPLYLNALSGRGCHLVTHNDFLARRDAEWNRPIFEMLGMRVGCVEPEMDPATRRAAYASDITYGTNNEFGFDYLRENMATRPEYLVQNSACWQAEQILSDLEAWSKEFGAKPVELLPYTVTLDLEVRWLEGLVERFGSRFGVDTISVKTSDKDESGVRSALGAESERVGEITTGSERIEKGRVHVRVAFLRHGYHFAIVDEVDSLLIDEARTPLIISGAVDRSTHRFDKIKPMVLSLVQKQTHLLTRLANEAAKEMEEDPDSYDAAAKLFQCQLGGPKNKRYMKLRTEPRVQKMVQKVEYDHILAKKNAKTSKQADEDPLVALEEDLYYVMDEKGHSIDLTEKGRTTLSPDDPSYFVLSDMVEVTEEIESRHNPAIQTLFDGETLDSAAAEGLAGALEKEGEELGDSYAEFTGKIPEAASFSEDELNELNERVGQAGDFGQTLDTATAEGLADALEKEGAELGISYEEFTGKIREGALFSEDELNELHERIGQAGDLLRTQVNQRHEIKSEELHNISQMLRACSLYEKDVEYVVEDNKVVIVDEFTGRKQPGRRFTDGLHQALEAKENVKIEKETQTLATITLQNYFRMYDKLAGMTGTAETEASEFAHTYKMDVMVIPTNRPIIRDDMDDVIYRTRREKYNAVIEEIERLHGLRLPVLVGTVSVDTSEKLSRMLRRRGISHNVLNAKNHENESDIVRHAGQPGQVTIATNMAGRGTDIKLGEGVTESRRCETYDMDWPGGLQIVGTERHDARRIDRQLRGRSGRQGDSGSSRFFLSLEDDLMRKFGSDRIAGIMQKLGLEEGEDIQHPWVTRAITKAQKRVEEWHFETRKRTLDYDNVMNKQREAIYGLRRQILEGLAIKEAIMNISYDAMAAEALTFKSEGEGGVSSPWDHEGFVNWVRRAIPFIDLAGIDARNFDDTEDLVVEIMPQVEKAYDLKTEMFGEGLHNQIVRSIALGMLDENWRDHLLAIDELREGIHLRSYGQLDPLVEYQREATHLFTDLMYEINKQIFTHLYKATLVQSAPGGPLQLSFQKEEFDPQAAPGPGGLPGPDGASPRPERKKGVTFKRESAKVGRNDPCPCGSGKKYKKCCGVAGVKPD